MGNEFRSSISLLFPITLPSTCFRLWRWGRNVPPKLRLTFNGLHGVISQTMALFKLSCNSDSVLDRATTINRSLTCPLSHEQFFHKIKERTGTGNALWTLGRKLHDSSSTAECRDAGTKSHRTWRKTGIKFYEFSLRKKTCEIIKSIIFWDMMPCSPTSGTTLRTARRHIPEDDTLQNHGCENLKSYMWNIFLARSFCRFFPPLIL
jgi:hypothetical protein